MTKKSKWYEPEGEPVPDELNAHTEQIDVTAMGDEKPVTIIGKPVEIKAYLPVMWAGILPTWQCTDCGHCDADEDAMILHCTTHVPEGERDLLLEKLLQDKEQ